MNYKIRLSGDIVVTLNVKKTVLGNHPKVSADLYYCGTKLYSKDESTKFGLSYDSYTDYHAFLDAMVLLGSCFREHDFVFNEFPYLKEYDCSYVERHYKTSHFPEGSTFMIMEQIIDRGGDVYYLLNNSEEGKVVISESQLMKHSEITNRFKRTIAADEVGIGFLSNNIIGKKFKVKNYSKGGLIYSEFELL